MRRGWWSGLAGAAVLFGLASAFGAADIPRRAVGAALLAVGLAGTSWLRRRWVRPAVEHGAWGFAGGAAVGVACIATISSLLLEAGTWWTSVLAAAWALVVVGVGGLACWCLASAEVAGDEDHAWPSTSTPTSG